jgi:hypothetical protein
MCVNLHYILLTFFGCNKGQKERREGNMTTLGLVDPHDVGFLAKNCYRARADQCSMHTWSCPMYTAVKSCTFVYLQKYSTNNFSNKSKK